MKITMREIKEVFTNDRAMKKERAASATPQKTDKLTISAQEPKTDAQLINMVKSQILNDVRAGAGADKLADLKMQVSTGSYDINPADIVNKMLFS